MNTQTHIIMGAALFGRPAPRFAVAGALGGLIPDLPMFAIIFGLRGSGYPLSDIFGKIYWEHWWQSASSPKAKTGLDLALRFLALPSSTL
jgi:hypothetical protein